MIGTLISKIRNDLKLSKTDISKKIGVDVGHLTHIEKEERNPSHKTLKAICDNLDVPYTPVMQTYDFELTEDQKKYDIVNHIKYDSVPVFSSISGFSKCPAEYRSATFVLKNNSNDMMPKIKPDDYLFVQCNCPLSNRDVGLFEYDNKIICRKFIIRKTDVVLRAEDDSIEDIILTKESKFFIIGKVLGSSENI